MWTYDVKAVTQGISLFRLRKDDHLLSFKSVARHWIHDDDFARFFTDILRDSPFDSYFWEVKPVTRETATEPFEFVLLEGDILERIAPNPAAFAEHFYTVGSGEGDSVVTFPNLGRDAQLIVPVPAVAHGCYGHLGVFLREAPDTQVRLFWQKVGEEYMKAITFRPHWLSTAGLGVPWLHARIDQRPKYYRYTPYKQME